MRTRIFVSVLCLSSVWANPVEEQKPNDNNTRLEMKLETAMDELNRNDSIRILGNIVTLEKVPFELDQSTERSDDPLVSKIETFFRSRKIQIKFPDDGSAVDYIGRALGKKNIDIELKGLTHGASEARTKLKRLVLPALLALELKQWITFPLLFILVAILSVKALGTGLLALLIYGAIALQALLTPPPYSPPKVSYGIVKPYDIHHEHWHRSQEEFAQPYRGWVPEYNDQYPYQETQGFIP